MDALLCQFGCTPRVPKCEARNVYEVMSNWRDAARKPVGVYGLPVAIVGGNADGNGRFTECFRQIIVVLRNNNKKPHTSKNNPSGTLREAPESFFRPRVPNCFRQSLST